MRCGRAPPLTLFPAQLLRKRIAELSAAPDGGGGSGGNGVQGGAGDDAWDPRKSRRRSRTQKDMMVLEKISLLEPQKRCEYRLELAM